MVDWDSLVNFKTVDDIDMLILKTKCKGTDINRTNGEIGNDKRN